MSSPQLHPDCISTCHQQPCITWYFHQHQQFCRSDLAPVTCTADDGVSAVELYSISSDCGGFQILAQRFAACGGRLDLPHLQPVCALFGLPVPACPLLPSLKPRPNTVEPLRGCLCRQTKQWHIQQWLSNECRRWVAVQRCSTCSGGSSGGHASGRSVLCQRLAKCPMGKQFQPAQHAMAHQLLPEHLRYLVALTK